MGGIPYIDVDYCQFCTWGYKKPTRVWCCPQIAQLNNVLCNPHTCVNVREGPQGWFRHKESLGGRRLRATARQKYRVPASLVDYLLSAPPLPEVKKGRGGASLMASEWVQQATKGKFHPRSFLLGQENLKKISVFPPSSPRSRKDPPGLVKRGKVGPESPPGEGSDECRGHSAGLRPMDQACKRVVDPHKRVLDPHRKASGSHKKVFDPPSIKNVAHIKKCPF